jgi:hypothetical protein
MDDPNIQCPITRDAVAITMDKIIFAAEKIDPGITHLRKNGISMLGITLAENRSVRIRQVLRSVVGGGGGCVVGIILVILRVSVVRGKNARTKSPT